eukprot:s7769_g5.t1
MTFATFKNKGEQQYGEISFLTNLPEGSLNRLESLEEGHDSEKTFDPRFAVLLSQCLVSNDRSDQRQAHLFEDFFENFDDGALCALCLRSERNSEALPVLPSAEEYSMLSNNSKGKLPDSLQFVAPQRFVTSSLVQTLTYVDNLLPGTELEVHTTTSPHAAALRPMIKGVRVLTLPYLEFEYCNVCRETYGKTLPLIHRHPDAVVILWNKGDHDHVFFLTMSQLLPCLKDMQANSWSMIVFWNESRGSTARPGQMLDWISRINQHLLPTCRRSCRLWGMKWTIQVMRIRAICQWTMRICHRRRAHVRNRISMMILRRSLPEAALRCRYREANTMTPSRMHLWIRTIMVEANLPEAVHRDRNLTFTGQRVRWVLDAQGNKKYSSID